MSVVGSTATLLLLALAGGSLASLVPPTLERLPAGAILPKGWLQDQAELQGNGMTGALGYFGGGISRSLWIDNNINGTVFSPAGGGTDCSSTGARPFEALSAAECPAGCVFVYGMRGEPNTCTRDDVEDGLGAQEEQGGGYYLNGMIPLSCQVDLPHLRALRDASVSKILKTASPDGYLGPVLPNVTNGKNPDIYWGRMSLVLGLQSFVECEGPYAPPKSLQAAMEQALVKHHISFYKHVTASSPEWIDDVWGSARYSEVLIACQWLIDRGHTDPELFELMSIIRGKSEAVLGWQDWFTHGNPVETMTHFTARCWGNKSDPTEHNWQKHHGVTIMEAIKTGAVWYRVTGNKTDADNSAAAVAWIDRWSRGSDGTFTSPDCISEIPHLPSSGPETCSVVEEMYSLRHAYETTGDIALFDRLEFVAFNSMPATTDRYWTGNSHYHSVNQIHASGTLGYNPFNGCCTGNVHQGWPKFIMSGIQTMSASYASAATAPGAQAHAAPSIVVSGYSPQEATLKDGTIVSVAGQYPFADNATIVIKPGARATANYGADYGNHEISLALRIPCWADSAEVIMHNAVDQVAEPLPATPCSLFHVPVDALRAASDSATGTVSLTVTFVHLIRVLENEWHNNTEAAPEAKFQHPAGAVEIRRGPLLFTFAVPSIENVTLLNGTCGNLCDKFKGLKTAMVRETVVVPDNSKPWQIALQEPHSRLTFGGFTPVSKVPFDHERPPATIKATAKLVHDNNPKGYAKGIIPDGPIPPEQTNGTTFDVELVPIGHSNAIRITVLPVLA